MILAGGNYVTVSQLEKLTTSSTLRFRNSGLPDTTSALHRDLSKKQ